MLTHLGLEIFKNLMKLCMGIELIGKWPKNYQNIEGSEEVF